MRSTFSYQKQKEATARYFRKLGKKKLREKRKKEHKLYKERHPEKIKEARARYSKNRGQWWIEFKKQLKCSSCPEKHHTVLDFHHKNPKTKKFNVGIAAAMRISKTLILKEIKKCVVLCSNCHRKHHWRERQKKNSV